MKPNFPPEQMKRKIAIWRAFRGKSASRAAPMLGFHFSFLHSARVLFCASLLGFSFLTHAQTATPPMPPAPPEMEARLKKLETELRCLVCQNQTLAESPAGLAGDLRREIRLLADAGKSNDEIKQHLRERYGDFVLYRPAVDSKTWLLWFGPFVLLFAGGGLLSWIARQRQLQSSLQPVVAMSSQDAARARALLGEADAVTGKILHEDDDIRRLLKAAKTIAVVGLSDKESRASFGVAKYLQAQGYRIIPVNPLLAAEGKMVLGEKCYASLRDIPQDQVGRIDIVDCFRKSADIPPVADEAIAVGARCLWMQLDIVNDAAAARATAAALDVVMNRCSLVEHRRLLS